MIQFGYCTQITKMAAPVLKSDTLGVKHQEYNKLLNEVLMTEDTKEVVDISFDDPDITNLLKIDIACHNKNVEYILNIFKSKDMLYVSRAIRKSEWLITEKQCENIINPDYLHNELFPQMTTKARIKLQKSIMHNLSDHSRREYFYDKEKCDKTAVKWLLGCSVPFIEEKIEIHCKHLNPKLLRRFCEKSISVFELLSKLPLNRSLLSLTTFLIYKHVDVYLDVLESSPSYRYPVFNARATETIMKYAPQRIINNFHIYVNIVNIPTFAKFIPKENIQSFLFKLAQEELQNSNYTLRNFFRHNNILYIIRQIPKDEQYTFVKKMFIDQIDINEENTPLDSELHQIIQLRGSVRLEPYVWYQFAPFEVAFEEIKKIILDNPSAIRPDAVFTTLIYATNNNMQNIQTLLNYYKNYHKNYDNYTKKEVIDCLLNNVNINNFDNKTWYILTEILSSMDVFEESSVDDENYIIAIIVYHVIRGENVPEIIEKKFVFNTFNLKSHCKLLNKDEKEKVFNYLCNYLVLKINSYIISNEAELKDAVHLIESYLHLLSEWERELLDHPLILIKIRELIEIRETNSWNIDLSSLYNINKSWRKHMFEESLSLCPSEKVCVNALKHDPTLFDRYKNEIEFTRTNNEVSLQRLLNKLRIFWSQSLAAEWANTYLNDLNIIVNHKAVIRGICGLLNKNEILTIVKTYAPKQEKINWSEIDDLTLSLQRHIAKNIHYARPQPDADAILLYAKGDYLNYALPSLIAIFYNMNMIDSRETFMKLLDARVSLLKHVVRFAFLKLEREQLKEIFSLVWKGTKNVTIRCIIFNYTFNILCDQKEDANIECYAELLEMFIDNLTSVEDKKIYDQFNKIGEISLSVRPNILMKSYKLFQRLNVSNKDNNINKDFNNIISVLVEHSREIMMLIPSEFATEIVNNYVNENFFTHYEFIREGYGIVNVISAYILSSKSIETQTERYETILGPLIKRCLNCWNEMHQGSYCIRKKLQCLLSTLRIDLKRYVKNINFEITHNLFSNILSELKPLNVSENYVLLTTWKLTMELAKLLSNININGDWNETGSKCAEDFGNICYENLKTDVETYFSGIYVLFAKALIKVTENIFDEHEKLIIFKSMLYDKELVQTYLCVIIIFPLPYHITKELKPEANGIMKTISMHPLVEVKMHYYNRFSKLD